MINTAEESMKLCDVAAPDTLSMAVLASNSASAVGLLTYDERLRAFIGAYSEATADASFWRTMDKNHLTEINAFYTLSNDQREDVIKGMALIAVQDVHEEFKLFKA